MLLTKKRKKNNRLKGFKKIKKKKMKECINNI